MSSKHVRDLSPGEWVSLRVLRNPADPNDYAHEWSEVVIVEPLVDAYRVHTGDETLILEGDEEIEVRDAAD